MLDNISIAYLKLIESNQHQSLDADGKPIHHIEEGIKNFHRWLESNSENQINKNPLLYGFFSIHV